MSTSRSTEDIKLPNKKWLAKLFHELTAELIGKFRGQIKIAWKGQGIDI